MRKFVGGFIAIFALGATSFILFALPSLFTSSYSAIPQTASSTLNVALEEEFKVVHLDTPEPLKALYMTACVAGTTTWRESLKNLIETTELNAIVIDIKDYTGEVVLDRSSRCYVKDLKEFVHSLHEADIYVIGRISVFQDPHYTKTHPELAVKTKSGEVWKDYKGLSFIDVGAREYWDYIVDISKESFEIGFDELNYDYVRYPSDGNLLDTDYTHTGTTTKPQMLENFFAYLDSSLLDYKLMNLKTSVDLFGMTTTVTNDMGIGQVLEGALPYFDYIAPMVYPSHYPKGWNGFVSPAEKPYEVITIAMTSALKREEAWRVQNGLATTTSSKMRPWLQDFHLGATYGPDKVKAQIQATYDTGLKSWMLWSAANKYTREALLDN